MLKIDLRKALGVLLGFVVLIEGGYLASIALPATVEDIGTITSGTVQFAGIQLAVLGAMILILWIVKDLKMIGEKPRLLKVLYVVGFIVNLIVLHEAIFVTLSARHIQFIGGDSFGPVAAALLSGQLMAVAMMSTLIWARKWRVGTNALAWLAGVSSCIGLATFAAIIMGTAGNVIGTELGGFLERTMFMGGTGLLLLSIISLLAWIFDSIDSDKRVLVILKKFFSLAGPLCLVVISISTIILSALAEDFEVVDTFEGSKLLLVAIAALWFFLAFLGYASWFVRKKPLVRSFVWEVAGILCGLIVATEGVAVLGMAGETTISGLGTLPHFITMMIGVQLVLLGGAVVMAWILYEHPLIGAGLKRTLLDGFVYLLTALITVDGLAGLAMAGTLEIAGIGAIMESTMVWFSAQLAALGLIALFVWIFRANGPTPVMKRFGFLIWMFLLLMLPAALLL